MTYPVGFSFNFKKDVEPEKPHRLYNVGDRVVFTKALESAAEQVTVRIVPITA